MPLATVFCYLYDIKAQIMTDYMYIFIICLSGLSQALHLLGRAFEQSLLLYDDTEDILEIINTEPHI